MTALALLMPTRSTSRSLMRPTMLQRLPLANATCLAVLRSNAEGRVTGCPLNGEYSSTSAWEDCSGPRSSSIPILNCNSNSNNLASLLSNWAKLLNSSRLVGVTAVLRSVDKTPALAMKAEAAGLSIRVQRARMLRDRSCWYNTSVSA